MKTPFFLKRAVLIVSISTFCFSTHILAETPTTRHKQLIEEAEAAPAGTPVHAAAAHTQQALLNDMLQAQQVLQKQLHQMQRLKTPFRHWQYAEQKAIHQMAQIAEIEQSILGCQDPVLRRIHERHDTRATHKLIRHQHQASKIARACRAAIRHRESVQPTEAGPYFVMIPIPRPPILDNATNEYCDAGCMLSQHFTHYFGITQHLIAWEQKTYAAQRAFQHLLHMLHENIKARLLNNPDPFSLQQQLQTHGNLRAFMRHALHYRNKGFRKLWEAGI